MKIILLDKIARLGSLGDVVEVRSGFGRNYLIPQGKAVIANAENIKAFEVRRQELQKQVEQKKQVAETKSAQLNAKLIKIVSIAGDGGKLFGSIGASDIVSTIKEQHNIEIERSDIRLPNGTIRSLGEYDISIALHPDVQTTITLIVASN